VQGRLRKAVITVEIETVCGHCDRRFTIELDSDMNFRIGPQGAEPLIFSPQVDWQSFTDPNILQAF